MKAEDGVERDEFEREVARALGKVQAPRELVEKVCAAAEKERRAVGTVVGWPLQGRWVSGMLAAGLVLAAVGAEGLHMRRVAERRARAEVEFATAMRVTDRTLAKTRIQLGRSGVRLFNE